MKNGKLGNKFKFVWIAAVMTLLGAVICLTGYAMGGRPGFYTTGEGVFTAQGIAKLKDGTVINRKETQAKPKHLEKTRLEPFDGFSISADRADITIIPSDGYYLEYELSASGNPAFSIEDNVLYFEEHPSEASIDTDGRRGWFYDSRDFIWENGQGDYYLKLYVPADCVFSLAAVSSRIGNVMAGGTLKAQDFQAALMLGGLNLEQWEGNTADFKLENGNLTVRKGLTARETCTINSSYGSVTLGSVSAPNITVTMRNNDLTAAVKEGTALNAVNSYGNVDITLDGKLEEYNFNLSTTYGEINAPYEDLLVQLRRDEGIDSMAISRQASSFFKGSLVVNVQSGTITVHEKQ